MKKMVHRAKSLSQRVHETLKQVPIYLRRHEPFKCGTCFFERSGNLDVCSHFAVERERARKNCLDHFENLSRDLLELDLDMIMLAREMVKVKPTFWDFLEWEVLGNNIVFFSPLVMTAYFPIFAFKLVAQGFSSVKSLIFPSGHEKQK
jgi:hypothetical protein